MDEQQEGVAEKKRIVYSEEEAKYRLNMFKKLQNARDDREKSHPEFDDMTYSQWYDTNKRSDFAYRAPKKNRREKRVATGLVREKDNVMLSTLLNYNFTPNIIAFDEDDVVINELGETMESLVIKSREMEDIKYTEKRKLIYREFIAQGDVFVEELWRETTEHDRVDFSDIEWKPGDPISQAQFVDLPTRKFERAEVRMISGKKVFLGDIRQPYIQLQPRVFTFELITHEEAQSIYGGWDRFDKIPESIDNTVVADVAVQNGTYQELDWSVTPVPKGKVGVLKYQSRSENHYQIFLNGVPMLPMNFPLTKVSPDGHYTIIQGKNEDMQDFAYSKSQPSKNKVDEAILNEFTRLMIIKMEQSADPAKGSKSKKMYRNSDFDPGNIVYGVKKDDIWPIVNTNGITAGDFSFYQMIKQSIEEKSVNKSFAGAPQNDNATATQILTEKEQQLLKLGLTLDGIISLEIALTWKRIATICKHWTQMQDTQSSAVRQGMKNVYRTIMIDAEVGGEEVNRVIRFADSYPDQWEQMDEERKLSKKYGKKTTIMYLNPALLQMFKGKWYITMVPKERNNDKLSQMMFRQVVQDAFAMFGQESVNIDYLKKRFASVFNESTNLFLNESQLQQKLQKSTIEGKPNPGGDKMKPSETEIKNGNARVPRVELKR